MKYLTTEELSHFTSFILRNRISNAKIARVVSLTPFGDRTQSCVSKWFDSQKFPYNAACEIIKEMRKTNQEYAEQLDEILLKIDNKNKNLNVLL